MQNPMQKFRQGSIVFEKLSIFSENLKTLTSPQLVYSSIFFAEISHTFTAYQCLQKSVWDCLDLKLFSKIKKDMLSTHSLFALLLVTQDLKKIKTIPHTLL